MENLDNLNLPSVNITEGEQSRNEYLNRSNNLLPKGGIQLDSSAGALGDFVKIDGKRWQIVNIGGTILAPSQE